MIVRDSLGQFAKGNANTLSHGHAPRGKPSPTYTCWSGMIRRCSSPGADSYQYYGARGITVCERWLKFENFLEDMGEKPTGLSIERINNELGYSPDNYKWATAKEQANNRRVRYGGNCRKGHPLTGANVRTRGNKHYCRTCLAENSRRWYAAHIKRGPTIADTHQTD